jgi:competence protein ComEC
VAGSLAWLAGWCAAWIAGCARLFGALPLAQARSPVALLVILLAVACAAVLWRAPRRARGEIAVACAAALCVLGAGWWATAERPHWTPPAGLRVTFLDVGQGDGVLVESPGAAVLVDQGPPEARVAEQLAGMGVRSLSALVLTHPQRDHIGGARDVLRRLRVGRVLHPGLPSDSTDERAALEEAARRNVPVAVVRRGDVFRLGRLTIRVLWPDDAGPPGDDPNRRATVLLVSWGWTDVLLTADAESDVTASLPIPPVEVLKVAHHGSEDSGLERQLDELRPKIAVISVGTGNDYGHPRAETIDALRTVPGLRL